MQEDIQTLIDKANSIIQKSGHGAGIRYPQKLKDIVTALANDHGLSVYQIIKSIPISQYSAREWPKQTKNKFKKIRIKKEQSTPARKTVIKKHTIEFQFILLSLQVLLLAYQRFLE